MCWQNNIRIEAVTVVKDIVEIEWKMFENVKNIGGRASCQDDWKTFFIMRSSQLEAWNEAMLASYLNDLKSAEGCGRNLLSEKYAYMMEHTSPQEFESVRDMIPRLSSKKKEQINRIAAIQLKWHEELAKEFPKLASRGRPIYSSEDNITVSVETYLKGELSVYSDNTLNKYEKYICLLLDQGNNLNRTVLANEVLYYGYKSLKQAEDMLRLPG